MIVRAADRSHCIVMFLLRVTTGNTIQSASRALLTAGRVFVTEIGSIKPS